MQDYLIVKGKIDLIKYEQAPEEYKPNEWTKLDQIIWVTIWMHLSQLVYYMVQPCYIIFQLWKTLSNTYDKKVIATKIYMMLHLYNLRVKESDSVQAHINKYESTYSVLASPRGGGHSTRGTSYLLKGRRYIHVPTICHSQRGWHIPGRYPCVIVMAQPTQSP